MKFISVFLFILFISACSSTPEPAPKKVVVLKMAPVEPPFKRPTAEQLDYLDVLRALEVDLENDEIRQLYEWVKAEYDYFYQTNFVTGSLVRGNRYIPYLQYRLRQAGLPIEYSYLAMIESAFRTVALSNKGAHGVWQLMPATAKELGITPEQRKDVVKATDAAIKYIQAREAAFGNDALLIAASYNAGEYGVSKRFVHVDSKRYNYVTVYSHLPKETRHYVPRWIAATMLANQIKRQGKMPAPESVLITDKDYQIAPLASALGMNKKEFETRNPDFVGEEFLTNQHNFIVHPNAHPVNAVDGLHISAATGFEPQFIAGGQLNIATRASAELERKALLAKAKRKIKPTIKRSPNRTSSKEVSQTQSNASYIKVAIQPGMTFSRLNRWFDVTETELVALNPSLKKGLRAGSEIKVPATNVSIKQYKVQAGDSLLRIASNHQVELDDIRLVNQIKGNHIRVGQVLTLYLPEG
ncbi:transglycosylase SLT domain-containing protein [Motilimonas cestriensis]|uniref:lytic transglycosylase domain-containing protein n=1 Tax=Motilimonas cestriensis TaxID=2742685 RepID=UPI003DA54A68